MLVLGFAALSLAVLLGGAMLAGRLWRLRIVHGVSGGAGVLAVYLALRAHALGGAFAWDVVGLGGLALSGGLVIALRGRSPLVVFLHAGAGGLAYLLLAGFVF